MSPPATATGAPERLEERLVASLGLIRHHQNANGEILAYRRDAAGNYSYRRSVLLCARVHDALACLDPRAPEALDGAVTMVSGPARRSFARTVHDVRRRIREFLIWQQEPAGWWRFLGRGSGIDPDVATTAAASTALAEGHGAHSLAATDRRQRVLLSFRAPSGWFFTFRRPDGGGYGWMDEHGHPIVGFDPVVNADVLEHLFAIGWHGRPETRTLVGLLEEEVRRSPGASTTAARRSTLYPHAASFPAAVARVVRRGHTLLPTTVRDVLRSTLLGLQRPGGDFGGPLTTALAATALLDLGVGGEPVARAKQAVLRGLRSTGGWTYEEYLIQGVGSPAWTTAACLGFLGRYRHLAGSLLS